MTNSSDERISALMDGELDEQMQPSAVDELLKKHRTRDTWARYHLISDTLRQSLPAGLDKQFSCRVMAALDAEPTVLAPPAPQVSSLTRRLAGLAVAASVAAVAVMGVQFMYQQDGQAPVGQLAQAPGATSPGAVSPSTVSSSAISPKNLSTNQTFARAAIRPNIQTVTQSMNSTTMSPSLAQQRPPHLKNRLHPNLNKYLLDHNQQTARAAVQGVMPYARIVADPNTYYIIIPAQK
jgi:sigma-E factor negative regulatory protein RseA